MGEILYIWVLNKEMYGKFHKNQVQARFCKM